MRTPCGPGDPRLLGIGEDPQLPLIQAVAFLVAVLVAFFIAKALLGIRR